MQVSKLSKPFYLGAITLFAATALAVAHPVVSHADDDDDFVTHDDPVTQMYSVPSGLKSVTQKDGNGLSYLDYIHLDPNTIKNSKLDDGNKDRYLGIADGLANVTKSSTINDNGYNQGYTIGQILFQAKKAAYNDSQSGQNTSLPYTDGKSSDGRSDCLMDAFYYGYLDGRKSQQTNQIQQQYVPGVTPLENQFYQIAFYQGYTESKNNVNPNDTNNQSPFGFDYNHIDGINEMLNYLHLPQTTKPAQYTTLSNSASLDNKDEFIQGDGSKYTGGTYDITNDLYTIQGADFISDVPMVFADESVGRLIVDNTKANDLAPEAIKSDNSNAPTSHLGLLLNDTDNTTTTDVTSNTNSSSNSNTPTNNNSSNTTSNNNVSSDSNANTSTNDVTPIIPIHHKKVTTHKVKKVVKKHVKKTTKKHTKKRYVVKKHVKKSKIKKSHAKFPRTVWANHRTGVHSVPQFNHGRTYFVAKGHKFHVYAKVSDGHGNWRYKVGKHKYITTIPGSINKHYVSYTHHHATHHHKR